MLYKFTLFIMLVMICGCNNDNIEISEGFQAKRITYTIEDEDTAYRFMRKIMTNPDSVEIYHATLIEGNANRSMSSGIIYIFLTENYHTNYTLRIEIGSKTLQYMSYKLTNKSSPSQPDEAIVRIGKGYSGQYSYSYLYEDYYADYYEPSEIIYSRVDDVYDQLQISFTGVRSGYPDANFDGLFYIKR